MMDNPFVYREETLESRQDRREVSRVWQGKYGKNDLLIARLSLEIPFCLLPVMIWINTFGFFQSGRHERNALFAVGGTCFLLLHILSAAGVLLAVFGIKNNFLKGVILVFVFIVFGCLSSYVMSNAIAYS